MERKRGNLRMATDWNINSDIYDIVDSVKAVQKRYIEDEDETTLSLGVFGFIADTESKKIQTATILAGQLGNEMFPTRAKLTKNVVAHATYNGITDINAIPAKITATLCVRVQDIDAFLDNDNRFFLDAMTPIFIGEYEFHLDYDVMIKKVKIKEDSYSYSAQYVMTDPVTDRQIINRLSDVINPYLKQPFLLNIGNESYLGIQATIRQYSIEEIKDTMVSDSIIENKTYTFEYANQMADFQVVITDNKEEFYITPYMYGSAIDPTDEYYCWYMYSADNTVRITFDSKSYVPGINSQIYIKSYTTLGAAGNFEYLGIDQTSAGLWTDLVSNIYGYKNITAYLVAVTDSIDGTDRKTKEELQKLIPKAAMSRGSITTETDLSNYFDLLNTESNRLVMMKKVDNQLNRVWYGYFLLKDDYGNIIPTNTIDIKIDITDTEFVTLSDDGRYILPAGTYLRYDTTTGIATPINESSIPPEYSEQYFSNGFYYYVTVYNMVLCLDPLYAAYYLTITEHDSYFVYEYVNEDCDTQFIANRFHFSRALISDQGDYNMSFNIAQSIISSGTPLNYYETVTVVDEQGDTIEKEVYTENLKVVLVIYREGLPYRWKECTYNEAVSDINNGIYYFTATISSDDTMDDKNRIKIIGCNEAGSTNPMYGYVDEACEARIYILANISVAAETDYPRKDLDNIAPGYDEYVVTNIYECVSGLDFYENYTGVTNTKITQISEGEIYTVSGVPCVGRHYVSTNDEVSFFIEALKERKAYIDYCLGLVENSMSIDFKFFNTYGDTKIYKLENKETPIGHIDINMHFKVSLRDASDLTTKGDIIKDIKAYVENINNTNVDLHIPNLITEITNSYNDRIYFIEFVGFNTFDSDDQHIIYVGNDSPYVVPEFINIRNVLDTESNTLVPDIDIVLV